MTRATLAKLKMQVVNKNQQVITEGMRPASAYSRIIVVHASAAGGGVYGFGYSPSFGKESRLLKVDACVQIDPAGAVERSHFSIHRGSGEPATRQNVQAWDRVIDFGTYAGFHGMCVWGQFRQFSWILTRRYTGEANRFGVVYYNSSTNTGVVHVFFEMSEG